VVTGFVLAGGLSSRFGMDKALFRVDGEPLAVRTARVLRAAGLDPVLVARTARNLGIPELLEPDGPRHPLWGVWFALTTVGENGAFFAPCDLPDLAPEHVAPLLAARAVAADQPLLGFYPVDLADRAREFALAGRPVRDFAADRPRLDVGSLRNLNRPPAGAGSAR
jgi:molybdopterin-guanine dinucleotide biosynthesis protein A